ncbi:MAG: hypothetical protein ACRYHQ_30630 [Janthinobacterium lividum]
MTDEPNPSEALQQQLDQANQRLVQSELRGHAIRAGIIDVDCLKLLDSSALKLDEHGTLPEAAAALAQLKRDKPWVFAQPNSSHPAPPPAPAPPQQKTAKDMTHAEWRMARDQLIKRR